MSRGDITLVVAAALLAAGYLTLGALGVRILVITSGSMTPTLQVGDLVMSQSVNADLLRPGELVTFRSALFHGDLVTHRVVRTSVSGQTVTVETKGDANSGSEQWSIPVGSKVGLGILHARYLGWWFAAVNTRPGHVAVLLSVCAGFAVTGLARIWAPR